MHPALILLTSMSGALLFIIFMILVVPWIDFVVTKLRINPFHYVGKYFNWCEMKQAELNRGKQ